MLKPKANQLAKGIGCEPHVLFHGRFHGGADQLRRLLGRE
jgi:hypothetical protein